MAAKAATTWDAIASGAAVSVSQKQTIMRGWLSGLGDEYPGQLKNETQVEQEDKGIFTLEPELAGLGQLALHFSDEEFSGLNSSIRSEDASTAFLRRQLIGKKMKIKEITHISAANLAGVEPGFQVQRGKGSGGPNQAPVAAVSMIASTNISVGANAGDEDDEDDIGRSGLGGIRKSAKHKTTRTKPSPDFEFSAAQSSKPVLLDPGTVEEPDQAKSELESTAVNADANMPTNSVSRKRKSTLKPKARSYLDEILAEKAAKKRKKEENKS